MFKSFLIALFIVATLAAWSIFWVWAFTNYPVAFFAGVAVALLALLTVVVHDARNN